MGVANMAAREKELLAIAFNKLRQIPRLHILADHIEDRLGVISFYVEDIHYNLLVKLLNDRYGVQVRGGCSCAGTYGHFLLHVDRALSKSITDQIDSGDLSAKPGWVHLSIHPTLEEKTLHYILEGLAAIVENIDTWQKDYVYCNLSNEFTHVDGDCLEKINLGSWFGFQ